MDITEAKCITQSERIFKNNYGQMVSKLNEEYLELKDELIKPDGLKLIEAILDEIADVDYMLNQLRNHFKTDYEQSLNRAFKKINKRVIDGVIRK